MLLNVTTTRRDGWSIVAAEGEIDISSAPTLDDALGAASTAGEAVAVDLRAVTFMDSSGLRSLLTARRDLDADGRAFVIVTGPGAVRRVLDVAGVSDHLTIVETDDDLPDA